MTYFLRVQKYFTLPGGSICRCEYDHDREALSFKEAWSNMLHGELSHSVKPARNAEK